MIDETTAQLRQERMFKGLTHMTAAMWFTVLLIGVTSIWLEKPVGGYTLMVFVVPISFLVYVIRRVYVPEGIFPKDWEEEGRAQSIRRWLGHTTVLVSVLLVIAWILLISFGRHVHATLPFLDWRILVKMILCYGFALIVLRGVCGLYIRKAAPVLRSEPFHPYRER